MVIGISSTLLIMITTFYITSMFIVVNAFTTHEELSVVERTYLFRRYDAVQIIRLSAYSSIFFLMDSLLTYQLYIIFLCDIRVIIFPVLCILTLFSMWIERTVLYIRVGVRGPVAKTHFGTKDIFRVVLPVILCVYSTLLIVFRIARNGRVFRRSKSNNIFGPVVLIAIESAFVYTILLSIMLVLYLKESVVINLFLHLIPPIIGLNYSVILTRVALRDVIGASQADAALPTVTVTSPSNSRAMANFGEARLSLTFGPTPQGSESNLPVVGLLGCHHDQDAKIALDEFEDKRLRQSAFNAV